MSSGAGGLRIVRLANFIMPRSGGLRTALRSLGSGYLANGHQPILVMPGERYSDEVTDQGRVITLPGPMVPLTGGYRVLVGRRQLARLLDRLAPDRLEVSDRTTLRWTGRWARGAGVPSVMVSHESLAGLLRISGLPGAAGRRAADALNARSAEAYDTIVCTTGWAAEEFVRIGVPVRRAPLGVDLETFHPGRHDPLVRSRFASSSEVLLVTCTRLSPEKKPELAVDALATLVGAGVPARLVVLGDGPRRAALEERAAGLPVTFAGFLPDQAAVAGLLASADVVIAPGPVETFGLAALEALACGTPVVVNAASALPEVVGAAGASAPGNGPELAAAVRGLLALEEGLRRSRARARAEEFSWPAATAGFLQAHRAAVTAGRARADLEAA
ncbi:alpha-1,6-mannosyltransferase [Asanoa ferruginea]|uniref:Alpha-1,6-mannosyltransferase n=1 Tax=Asanoa ferruginea TaxID=53367 RepID=A0A3D9ZC08_9ACTN|nr:glycosyltransferase [Asanoa ferruginea]REF94841.1 alpha-1,6-mannosyltransferase [Asanoa ferruginea]GIF45580.1 GDP-mannose-dependent alpha-(1-6)-phosphatidylinositol dimannoside mannosyltransferase [Asanoa ferruginea]